MDPPSFPSKPFSPNRFKLSCLGLFAGLVLGIGVAGGVEFFDDRVYDEESLKKLVPAEVLVEIPPLNTPYEEQDKRKKLWLGLASGGVIGLIVLAGTAISFLRG